METPFFLIHKKELEKNVLSFKAALNEIWPYSRLAYSVKTNSLPWILKYLKTQNVMMEVVSDEEYDLVLMCGFDEEEIVFNGPIKGESAFLKSVNKGTIVNIDSNKELNIYADNFKGSNGNIGIRINVDTSIFGKDDIIYTDDGFRFGFSEKNNALSHALDLLRFGDQNNRVGLHLHCNTLSRSLDVYRKIAEFAKYIIETYEITPSFINMGGGFFGGVKGQPTAKDYIAEIYEVLKDAVDIESTMLIVEPGSAIIASAAEFHTSVIDAKETDMSNIITTDGSRINIDPLWARKKYFYRIDMKDSNRKKSEKQIICGYTCMDHDRIMTLENKETLACGDKIIYEKVGAYTMTYGGPFIRYFPEVYAVEENGLVLVRKRMKGEEYYSLHTL